MNAMELHDLYKQRYTRETWIEPVKGHVMAGSTLTDDFRTNDILWQLSVLAYNIPASWPVRQRKSKFKKQEHRSFIDWFIAVPARIACSGHQTELKMYSLSRESKNIIFINPTGKSLIFQHAQYNAGSLKRHKNTERR